MKSKAWPLYLGFVVFAILLYVGTDVKSTDQKAIEKSRALVKQSKSSQVLLRDAYHELDQAQRVQIDEINILIEKAEDEESELRLTEQLAGLWYTWGRYDVSGYYAEQIADVRNSADAWSIAGTTYSLGIRNSQDEQTVKYCTERARAAFDQAKLLQPENPDADLNKALTYVYRPEEDNPMAGIQMLLEVKNKYPDYAPVYRNLGTFAIQTGQFEKALERLRQAWALEGDKGKVSCLLAQAFEATQAIDSAQYYTQICKNN